MSHNKILATPRPTDINRALLNERVGKAVRQHRNKSGKTIAEVALATGMTGQTVSKVESGDYPISLHNLVCIAKCFGVTLNDLVPMEEPA